MLCTCRHSFRRVPTHNYASDMPLTACCCYPFQNGRKGQPTSSIAPKHASSFPYPLHSPAALSASRTEPGSYRTKDRANCRQQRRQTDRRADARAESLVYAAGVSAAHLDDDIAVLGVAAVVRLHKGGGGLPDLRKGQFADLEAG